jgi:hypothetical protein
LPDVTMPLCGRSEARHTSERQREGRPGPPLRALVRLDAFLIGAAERAIANSEASAANAAVHAKAAKERVERIERCETVKGGLGSR